MSDVDLEEIDASLVEDSQKIDYESEDAKDTWMDDYGGSIGQCLGQ